MSKPRLIHEQGGVTLHPDHRPKHAGCGPARPGRKVKAAAPAPEPFDEDEEKTTPRRARPVSDTEKTLPGGQTLDELLGGRAENPLDG